MNLLVTADDKRVVTTPPYGCSVMLGLRNELLYLFFL